jgi:hypothetical protein
MTALYALVIGTVMLGLRWWNKHERQYFPPDHASYLAMSEGRAVPTPFRERWLLPFLMRGASETTWWWTSNVGALLTFPLIALFAEAAGVNGLWACALWGAFPGVDVLWRMKGIVDHLAWPMALLAGWLFSAGYVAAGIGVCFAAGFCDSRMPVMVAAWTLQPAALLGLIPYLGLHACTRKGAPVMHSDWILRPWTTSRDVCGKHLHDGKELLLPWGPMLAGLLVPAPALWLSLAAAYGQLLRGHDRVRHYGWAAPVVIVCALRVIPGPWLPLALALAWFNPWRPVV